MKTVSWACSIPILLAVLFSGFTCAAAGSNQPQVEAALFSEFDTAFYARAGLLANSGGYEQLSEQSANSLRAPFADLLAALDPLGKQVSAEMFGNADAVLLGAKDFSPPTGSTGLGDVHSQFCYVVVLRSRSSFNIGKVAGDSTVISSNGGSTWKWAIEPTEGQPEGHTVYATQVDNSYLLISNNAGELQTMTEKIASADTEILGELPDWRSIRQHEVWGYRQYRHTEVTYRDAAGLTYITPTAQALMFFFDSGQNDGVLRLLATDDSTAEKMNAAGVLTLTSIGSGVWEESIPLSHKGTSTEQMFDVLCLFGLGAYL